MKRRVIVGGADIKNYEEVREYLRPDDYFIVCDSGLKHLEGLMIHPNEIVGDFDSHENPHMDVPTTVLPTEKDDTDTVYAVRQELSRGADNFLLVGVIGNRIDHTLGNVSILTKLAKRGARGMIVDDYSEMIAISGDSQYFNQATVNDSFEFFSVVVLSEKAEGITIENAKYEISDAVIKNDYQYGLSNEVTPGMTARITVKRGDLLIVKDRKQ